MERDVDKNPGGKYWDASPKLQNFADRTHEDFTPRNIQGGSNANDVFSPSKERYSTAGEESIKYLGGPLRSYTGKARQLTLLEVVIQPPITTVEKDVEATGCIEELCSERAGNVLARIERVDKSDNETTVNKESSDAQMLNQALSISTLPQTTTTTTTTTNISPPRWD
ncbi:hypothetical protein ACHAW6_003151 [Cyclotella cf. meneghiniana]